MAWVVLVRYQSEGMRVTSSEHQRACSSPGAMCMRAGALLAEQDCAGLPQARQARHRGHQHAGVHDRQPHTHTC